MNTENPRDRKRKIAAVAGAIATTVGGIAMLCAGMESTTRKSYNIHNNNRQDYLDSIYNGTDVECHHLLRMNKEAFYKLVALCKEKKLLRDSRHVKVEEQMAGFLHTIGHNQKNRVINHNFIRSGETVSRYFHVVLKAILNLHDDLVKQPTKEMETHQKIQSDPRFFPFFKDCVGAIDGTHVRVNVPDSIRNRFRGRKDNPTQNILAAVSFDLKFTYVLAGWEGSAHDARVLEDALKRPNGLVVPEGKYYLVDAGYTHCKGFLAPFRKTRYHLTEFDNQHPNPTTPEELFNHRHSSLRNTVERAFGVLKKRWKILDDSEAHFDYDTQVNIVLAGCILHNHIMGVDPDDALIAEVQGGSKVNEQEEEEEEEEEEEVVIAQATRLTRLTRREQREENQRWKEFRMKIVNDMWAQKD